MAETPLTTTVPSPWRYRLLNPWLASLLSRRALDRRRLSHAHDVFAFASSLAMRTFLRRLSLSPFAAGAGASSSPRRSAAMCRSALLRLHRRADQLPDAARPDAATAWRPAVTAALLGVGTIAKESLLLLLPFVVERARAAAVDVDANRDGGAGAAGRVRVLRLIVGTAGESPLALNWETQVAYWRTAMVHGAAAGFCGRSRTRWARCGCWRHWPRRGTWRFLGIGLWLIVPLIAPIVRTTDTERALLLAFPVVLPLAISLSTNAATRGAQLCSPLSCASRRSSDSGRSSGPTLRASA